MRMVLIRGFWGSLVISGLFVLHIHAQQVEESEAPEGLEPLQSAAQVVAAPSAAAAEPVPAAAPSIFAPAVPQAPQQIAPEPETAPSGVVASEDFDTSKIKEYGGNWYFKRAWWQNSEGEYEKARQVLEQLFEARMAFFEKRNELERTLFEPFYRNMGFEQGELQDIIIYLIDQIEAERAEEGALDIKEREFLKNLQEEKKTLEQLKLDIDQLSKFDEAIDDSIDMLIKQINQARQYEQAAWKEFKAIAEELSDTKARERYYIIRSLYQDIKNIYEYVRGDFKKYFDKLEEVSKNEAERIKTSVKSLKGKGIDLKEQAKKLVEDVPAKKTAPVPEPVKPDEEAQPGVIMGAIYAVGGFFKAGWNFLFGWLYTL